MFSYDDDEDITERNVSQNSCTTW